MSLNAPELMLGAPRKFDSIHIKIQQSGRTDSVTLRSGLIQVAYYMDECNIYQGPFSMPLAGNKCSAQICAGFTARVVGSLHFDSAEIT